MRMSIAKPNLRRMSVDGREGMKHFGGRIRRDKRQAGWGPAKSCDEVLDETQCLNRIRRL